MVNSPVLVLRWAALSPDKGRSLPSRGLSVVIFLQGSRPLEHQGDFLSPDTSEHDLCIGATMTKPLPVAGAVFTVHCPVPTDVQEAKCLPVSLSPASLVHHRWTSCNPLTSPPLIPMWKGRCKAAISGACPRPVEMWLTWRPFHQFGSIIN